MQKFSSGTMAAVIMILFVLTIAVECIDPYRVRLIDSNTQLNRYFFRGNTPIEHGNFAIAKLRDVVRDTGKKNNVQIPDDFFLVDVSLLNMFEEDLKDEQEYFKANPHIGQLVHWTILGNPINGTDLPEWLRKDLAIYEKKWDREDKLIDRVDQLYNWVHTQDSIHNLNQDAQDAKALVFYIHCEAGMDRTGEVSGSYYLKYNKWTYMQTLDYDYHVENPSRPIEFMSQNALNWYCWHQFYTTGYPNDCNLSLSRDKK